MHSESQHSILERRRVLKAFAGSAAGAALMPDLRRARLVLLRQRFGEQMRHQRRAGGAAGEGLENAAAFETGGLRFAVHEGSPQVGWRCR